MRKASQTENIDSIAAPTAEPDVAPMPPILPVKREWRAAVLEAASERDTPELKCGSWGCACRKSNSHIQMMKSAKKWRRQNATNGMYCSRRRRVLVD